MDSVKLEIGTQGDWIILVISGRLDRMNAEEVGQQGEELLSRSSKLALDLRFSSKNHNTLLPSGV